MVFLFQTTKYESKADSVASVVMMKAIDEITKSKALNEDEKIQAIRKLLLENKKPEGFTVPAQKPEGKKLAGVVPVKEERLKILATYAKGLTQQEAIDKAKKEGYRLLTNKEFDAISQDKALMEKYKDAIPSWIGINVEYSGTKCKVTVNGETYYKTIPKKDGWYKQDELGLPFGKPSSRDDPDARYLYRTDEYSGLVARGDYGFDFYGGRRNVIGDYLPSGRRGVLISTENARMDAPKPVEKVDAEKN
jgi:hypothetical protein